MAYISKELIKKIRQELKTHFPQFKLSVTNKDYSGIEVSILSGPIRFSDVDYKQLNHYFLDGYANSEILKKMLNIINQKNYNHSESQVDYYDVGYYITLNQGCWNKPYVLVE